MKRITSVMARLSNKGFALTLACTSLVLGACSTSVDVDDNSVTQFVDPFIGTANDGNNYPGAVVPWGLANVSPHNIDFKSGKAPTSYRFGNDYIYNFGHMQLAGVGCPATGSLPMKVTTGELSLDTVNTRSRYSHEVAEPGYYKVYLDTFKVTAEMTATQRTGFTKFEIPAGKANLIFDLAASQSEIKGGKVTLVSPTRIDGYQIEENFCSAGKHAKIYYSVDISNSPTSHGLIGKDGILGKEVSSTTSTKAGAFFTFENQDTTNLEIRVGLSLVSAENARLNLTTEQQDLSFEQVKQAAKLSWQNKLSKLQVKGNKLEDKVKFYSAFYHALIMPQVMSDVNGEYPSNDRKTIKKAEGYTRYTTFSLWDTYRTLHPLITLTHPKQQQDMVRSMVEGAKESGWLPKWELLGTESGVMVGDPAVPVIVDSYVKGLQDFDLDAALKYMVKGGSDTEEFNIVRPGIKDYINDGYLPEDQRGGDPKDFGWFNGIVWGPVSTTQEYNLADWNISQFAKALGKDEIAETFYQRSQSFTKLYDEETGFFRPKNKDGSWMTPFNPLDRHYDIRWKKSGGRGFVEGTAWQYLFFVPHNVPKLIELMGAEQFESRLTESFENFYFDMTNEPDIQYPFLYNYLPGKEYKTQEVVHYAVNKYFNTTPHGIPGNDDAGTLSAWLVFAMMGIYPDLVGSPDYQIATPTFSEVKIELDPEFYPGGHFTIKTKGLTDKNFLIEDKSLNGKPHSSYQINHQAIVNGGEFEISVK